MTRYHLLLQGGRVVDAAGEDPIGACQMYANNHPGEVVMAWRDYMGRGEIIAAIPIEADKKAR